MTVEIREIDPATIPAGPWDEMYESVVGNLTQQARSAGRFNSAQNAIVVLDQIINIGSKLWAIVEKNQATLAAETTTASAVPDGIKSWKDLGGWKDPITRAYEIVYKNLYGVRLRDFCTRRECPPTF